MTCYVVYTPTDNFCVAEASFLEVSLMKESSFGEIPDEVSCIVPLQVTDAPADEAILFALEGDGAVSIACFCRMSQYQCCTVVYQLKLFHVVMI